MKPLFKVLGLAALVLASFKALDVALAGMSSPSDFGFYGGALYVIAIMTIWTLLITKIVRRGIAPNRIDREDTVSKDTGRHVALMLAFTAFMAVNAGCTRVDAGHVGIVVDLAGSQRGVQDYTLTTGWVWYNPFGTDVVKYPTFVQTAKWTKDLNEGAPLNEEITFTNKDSMLIAADISLSYSLKPDKVPNFYVKFRNDDIKAFTHGFLRNVARDMFNETAGKYTIEQIMGDNGPFLAEVRLKLQKEVEPIGVVIEQFGFIGAPRPPQGVVDSINAKVQAIQDAAKAENKVRQSQAEAQQRIALAEGEAKANSILTSSLTPTLLEWRRLAITEKATDKWNGQLPYYNGSGLVPFIQIPNQK